MEHRCIRFTRRSDDFTIGGDDRPVRRFFIKLEQVIANGVVRRSWEADESDIHPPALNRRFSTRDAAVELHCRPAVGSRAETLQYLDKFTFILRIGKIEIGQSGD